MLAYMVLCPFKHLFGDFIKLCLLSAASLCGMQLISNWSNHGRKCYPIIAAGLLVSGLGFFLGGFPNLFDVTKINVFDLNGMMPLGYFLYLIVFVAWTVLAKVAQNSQVAETEQRTMGGPPGMKRMLI